jgi:hypothetical protein
MRFMALGVVWTSTVQTLLIPTLFVVSVESR